MLYIPRHCTDPWINLATEEYVLKNYHQDVFMLWINDPCIVIGKHQNPFAEINFEFARKYHIPVIRRISGGGTVYHDHGNLNFTFVCSASTGNAVNFAKYIQPVIKALISLGLDARHEGRNDIRLNGLKISGNAEHVFKNRVLHHGTLLFDTNLDHLEKALQPPDITYEDKAVRSVRSKVTNISFHLEQPLSLQQFKETLEHFFFGWFPNMSIYEFTEEEMQAITQLARSKYQSWEWNFGYSPDFKCIMNFNIDGVNVELILEVTRGTISGVKVSIEKFQKMLSEALSGQRYDPLSLKQFLHDFVSKHQMI